MQNPARRWAVGTFLMVLGAASGNAQPQESNTTSARQAATPDRRGAAKVVPNSPHAESPAARYSPLAAAGGYKGQHVTWYDALLHSLNPKNIDWGLKWEQRRADFVENSVGNKYFVFCAFLVLCFYAALVAIGWIVRDHKQDIRYFETELVKGRNWATYWRNRALEAITKHNEHIERCNRVIEAGESSVSIGNSEAADLRRELERTRTELQNTTSEKLRLEAELDEKKRMTTELSLRVDEVTKRIGKGGQENGAPSGTTPDEKAALVARINRLETALAAATQENRRLKGA
jgi:hypothetical protein